MVAGGLERVVADLSLSLTSRGHSVELFWTNHSELDRKLVARGLVTHDCRPGRFSIPGVPHRLTKALRQFRPELLHAHSGVWYPASIGSMLLRKPLVFTDHGRYLPERRRIILLQRWCAHFTNEIVTVSEALSVYVQQVLHLDHAPQTVDNGIDLEPFRTVEPSRRRELRTEWGFTDSDVVVVASGRLVPVKNLPGLLQALADAGVNSLRVVLLGTGPLEAELRARAADLGVDSRVRFLGMRQDVADCLHASDVFAMPSDSEGLPVALLEAMAAGLPIVASAVGAIPSVLGSPPAGILVQPRDTAALASALVQLATDGGMRRRLGALAGKRASLYTLARMTDRYERIYGAIVRGPSVRSRAIRTSPNRIDPAGSVDSL